MMPIEVVIGLGNPGKEYARTRHNIGFLVIDRLRELLPEVTHSKGKVMHRWVVRMEEQARNQELQLVKPQTYMNRSGLAVQQLREERSIPLGNILVVVDDLYLPLGSLRYREGGSAGGQRGLASIMDVVGSDEVPRLRLGVGPCPSELTHADFVLSSFASEDEDLLRSSVDSAAEAIIFSIRHAVPLVIKPVAPQP